MCFRSRKRKEGYHVNGGDRYIKRRRRKKDRDRSSVESLCVDRDHDEGIKTSPTDIVLVDCSNVLLGTPYQAVRIDGPRSTERRAAGHSLQQRDTPRSTMVITVQPIGTYISGQFALRWAFEIMRCME
jgi:hypothetical protein